MANANADVGRAAATHGAAARHRAKLERRAGRARREYAKVNDELTDAIDVFANEEWSVMTLDQIAKAGGRIARLARSLSAARKLPHAAQIEAGALAELNRARANDE